MAITPEEFRQLELQSTEADRAAAEARGALAERKRLLKKEFGLDSVKAAGAECRRLDAEVAEAEAVVRKLMEGVADAAAAKPE